MINASKWLVIPAKGDRPPALSGHTLTTIGNKVFLFGGLADHGYNNDVYVFDPESCAWSRPITRGTPPPARGWHSTTQIGKKLYVFGGCSATATNDLYTLDIDQLIWTKLKPAGTLPSPRESHTALTVGGKLIVMGGRGAEVLHDIHVLDTIACKWSSPHLTGLAPSRLLGQCGAMVAGGDIWIVGGQDDDRNHLQAFLLDLGRMRWQRPILRGVLPTARGWQSCASRGRQIYVFGGYSSGVANDLWMLDVDKKQWTYIDVPETTCPSARESHAMTMIADRLYLYGGFDGQQRFDGLYCINTVSDEEKLERSLQVREQEIFEVSRRQQDAEAENTKLMQAVEQLRDQLAKQRDSKDKLAERLKQEQIARAELQAELDEERNRGKVIAQSSEAHTSRAADTQRQLHTEIAVRMRLEKEARVWNMDKELAIENLRRCDAEKQALALRLERALKSIELLQQEIDTHTAQKGHIESSASQLSEQLVQTEHQLASTQQLLENEHNEVELLSGRLQDALQIGVDEQRRTDEWRVKHSQVVDEARVLKQQLAAAEAEVAAKRSAATQERDEQAALLRRTRAELESQQARVAELQRENIHIKASIVQLETIERTNKDTIQHQLDQIRQALLDNEKMRVAMINAEESAKTANSQLADEKASKRVVMQQQVSQRDKATELGKEVARLRGQNAELEKQRAKLEGQVRQANMKLTRLLKENTGDKGELGRVTSELTQLIATKDDITSNVHALAMDLERETGLRRAAEKEKAKLLQDLKEQREKFEQEKFLLDARLSQEEGMRHSAESRANTEQESIFELTEALNSERTRSEHALADLRVCLQSEQEVRATMEVALETKDAQLAEIQEIRRALELELKQLRDQQ
eukprot:TRINITY_DN9886_c0_g1_i2.p1 TRINITY_DN9886_c0_g1~~TRINITY_DN9886_c0_g1_i2.p1  ORF type:complete len:871 (-),score=239.72 TRINITY_DN9886_c0_g1_i2:53-2665(-)